MLKYFYKNRLTFTDNTSILVTKLYYCSGLEDKNGYTHWKMVIIIKDLMGNLIC